MSGLTKAHIETLKHVLPNRPARPGILVEEAVDEILTLRKQVVDLKKHLNCIILLADNCCKSCKAKQYLCEENENLAQYLLDITKNHKFFEDLDFEVEDGIIR